MRHGRILILLLILLTAVFLEFSFSFRELGSIAEDIPLKLSFNNMDADAEAGSVEEFQAIMAGAIRDVRDSIKVRIKNYDEEMYDINSLLQRVLDEDAGLSFVIGCNASFSRVIGEESAALELKLQYLYPREKLVSMREETENKANEIVKGIIKKGASDYEKVLAVHDYIVKGSRYDRPNADRGTVPAEEHEAYGVLVKGIGVCDSYAKAMKLVMEKAGVQCLLVEGSKAGDAVSGPADVDHAWNIVKLDGEYYHVDATWDDVSEEKDSNELVYHHFNLNDEEMQKTHIWDRSKYPACTGTKYNYYTYNKLTAENYADTLSMLIKAIDRKDKKLAVKIAGYKSSAYNMERLIKKAVEKSMPGKGLSAKWTINEPLGIMDIEFEY